MILDAFKTACFDAGLLHVMVPEVYQVPISDDFPAKQLFSVSMCLTETLILVSFDTVSEMSSPKDMSVSYLFYLLPRCQVHYHELFSPQ
jgi:hypothetical protein